MRIRFLGRGDVEQVLPLADAIDAVEQAYVAVSSGAVRMPVRVQLEAGAGVSVFMPATAPELGRTALKAVSVYPGNAGRGLPTITGLLLLLDADTGRPLAAMEASHLTALRTGAASGVAARHLAREEAGVLALFGAGAQAPYQALAVCAVRPIREVRIVNRTRERAERLAAHLAARLPGVRVRVAGTAAEALEGADVVCTATSATEPLFDAALVPAGALVAAVGSFRRGMRELPRELLQRARVVVDQREAALEEAGELIDAVEAGALDPAALVEIGEIALGRAAGRRAADETVVFKSVGLAAQDLYAAARAYERALALGIGADLDLDGEALP